MTGTAVLLLLASAVVHAAWNLGGKRETPTAAFFLAANLLVCLYLSPILLFAGSAIPAIPPAAWGLLALTGLFQAIYFSALAAAYRSGELSVAYPIARSAAVLFVTLANVALGRGRQMGPAAFAGMAVIAFGILMLPFRRFREIRGKRFLEKSTIFALLAAIGTMGYSMIDDGALRMIRPALEHFATHGRTALLYYLFEAITTSCWLFAFVLARRFQTRLDLPVRSSRALGRAALTGAGICLAYALVLLAMEFARNVSYVVAFRQMGIPIGVVLGLVVLHEKPHAPKIAGALTVLAGLILVAIG